MGNRSIAMNLVVVLLVTANMAVADSQECGSEAGGRICLDNSCCSKEGRCGDTRQHCSDGCQSNCRPPSSISKNNTIASGTPLLVCHPEKLFPCPSDIPCCNNRGFCGWNAYDCGQGCQAGACLPKRCGANVSFPATCPEDSPCCSMYGYCGSTGSYCGEGCQAGACHPKTRCGNVTNPSPCPPEFPCCSVYGYCGWTGSYCGEGCQGGACHPKTRCGNVTSTSPCPRDFPCCSKYGYCGSTESYCGQGCQGGPCLPKTDFYRR